MVSINTNLSSLIVQNSLNKSTNALNRAIERMTTGYKINGAKDNAANYSISTDFSSKLSSYTIAQDNIASGLDMIATAQDTISLMQNHGERLMDLWTQAQNGTYGSESITAIQSEVDARLNEINRLYQNAEYNEISLFENYSIELPAWAETVASTAGLSSDISPTNNGFIDTITAVTPEVTVTDPTQLATELGSDKTIIGIGNAATLAKLAELVNGGTTCEGKTIVLTDDVDISAYCTLDSNGRGGWNPIGDNHTSDATSRFAGTFDGQGHKVSGLKIVRDKTDDYSGTDYQGLFGYATGEIKNVGLENASVKGNGYIGGLIGHTGYSGTISNSYATGSVSGTGDYTGGLAGNAYGLISNSYATGSVSSTGDSTGGLVGYAGATISNSYATGSVSGTYQTGGLAGHAGATISNSYATGSVSGTNANTGGLAGTAEFEISNSYATGSVSGKGGRTGGLVGSATSISNSYATGSVSGTGDNAGGLAGVAVGTISNSYATGNVSGKGDRTGGLVGVVSGSIKKAYATGNVSGTSDVGGLAGDARGAISNSYATGNVSGTVRVGGLVGEIYKTSSGTLKVNKAASFGKVTGGNAVGSLVGGIVDTTDGSNWYTVTFTNAQARNQGMNAVGGEFKYASSTYTPVTHAIDTWNSAISLIDLPFAETTLQVGIYGGSSSQVSFDSNLALNIDVSDITSASAYNSIKAFLDSLNEKATVLGAAANRLESALESTTTQINNLTSSLSTIRDADVAVESSKYIKSQILQQASATLLATANQSPSIALQLI